jgi:hypothetical protein
VGAAARANPGFGPAARDHHAHLDQNSEGERWVADPTQAIAASVLLGHTQDVGENAAEVEQASGGLGLDVSDIEPRFIHGLASQLKYWRSTYCRPDKSHSPTCCLLPAKRSEKKQFRLTTARPPWQPWPFEVKEEQRTPVGGFSKVPNAKLPQIPYRPARPLDAKSPANGTDHSYQSCTE